MAHSVVEDEKGSRFDVTPQRPIGQYSFLEDEAFDEEYMLLITSRRLVKIEHYLGAGSNPNRARW